VYVPEEMEAIAPVTVDVQHVEVIEKQVSEAIAEMYTSATMEELKEHWQNNKQFQKERSFIGAKEAMKAKLNETKS